MKLFAITLKNGRKVQEIGYDMSPAVDFNIASDSEEPLVETIVIKLDKAGIDKFVITDHEGKFLMIDPYNKMIEVTTKQEVFDKIKEY